MAALAVAVVGADAANAAVAADVTSVAPPPDQGLRGLRRTILPNGLTVLTETMPWVRSVALGAWVRAASVHEPAEKMGVSHLLEHMVFKGTARRSAKEIALALEVLGGSLDAYTSREHTCFQARMLDEHLTHAADVLADLVFSPALRQRDLELERKVVLEEINMVEDTPDDLVFELHNAELWGNHPYGYTILGTRKTVAALTTDDLRDLLRTAYRPSNIVVSAAGNLEHEQLLDILNQTGWSTELNGDLSVPTVPTPVAPPPKYTHVSRDIAQTHVVFGSQTVGHADPRRYTVLLLSTVLGAGMSSRLFQRVREELGLAYAIQSFHSFHADTGIHGVYVAAAPDVADDAVAAIVDELEQVAANGLPEDEIVSGKNQLKGQLTIAMESVSARMYRAAGAELYGEPYQTVDDVLALIEAIRADEIASVAREFFAPSGQTVLSLGKKELKL
jgi:predicted Zn-dependent peptidase